jgi:hypothetical protein
MKAALPMVALSSLEASSLTADFDGFGGRRSGRTIVRQLILVIKPKLESNGRALRQGDSPFADSV